MVIDGKVLKIRDITAKLYHPESIANIDLRNIQCEESGCLRCDSGRGGYRFHWVGPWTCRRVVDAGSQDGARGRAIWLNCTDCEACSGPARRRPAGNAAAGHRGP